MTEPQKLSEADKENLHEKGIIDCNYPRCGNFCICSVGC